MVRVSRAHGLRVQPHTPMFGISILVLGGIAFLAVTVTALVLVFTRGEKKTSCGCCAGCGLGCGFLLTLILGVLLGALFLGSGQRRGTVSLQHIDPDDVIHEVELGLDKLGERLDHLFDD